MDQRSDNCQASTGVLYMDSQQEGVLWILNFIDGCYDKNCSFKRLIQT